jgi:hypothetical protein
MSPRAIAQATLELDLGDTYSEGAEEAPPAPEEKATFDDDPGATAQASPPQSPVHAADAVPAPGPHLPFSPSVLERWHTDSDTDTDGDADESRTVSRSRQTEVPTSGAHEAEVPPSEAESKGEAKEQGEEGLDDGTVDIDLCKEQELDEKHQRDASEPLAAAAVRATRRAYGSGDVSAHTLSQAFFNTGIKAALDSILPTSGVALEHATSDAEDEEIAAVGDAIFRHWLDVEVLLTKPRFLREADWIRGKPPAPCTSSEHSRRGGKSDD